MNVKPGRSKPMLVTVEGSYPIHDNILKSTYPGMGQQCEVIIFAASVFPTMRSKLCGVKDIKTLTFEKLILLALTFNQFTFESLPCSQSFLLSHFHLVTLDVLNHALRDGDLWKILISKLNKILLFYKY